MRLALAAAAVAALAFAPAARADIFAVADTAQPDASGHLDIGLFDASTGVRQALPAGIDTPADEDHASISSDGAKLVFERRDEGTTRVLLAQLPSGSTTDLYTGFDQISNPQSGPAISPDGTTIATGERFQTLGGGAYAAVGLTNASTLAHSQFAPPYAFAQPNGSTADPVLGGSLVVYRETRSGLPGELILGHLGAGAPFPLGRNTESLAHPAIGAGIIAFDERPLLGSGLGPGDIAFTSLTGFPASAITELPQLINTIADESRPAFTPDGRYLGFIRHNKDGADRLFVWDSETQTLINNPATGVPLGTLDARDVGNLSLYEKTVLAPVTIIPPIAGGTIHFNLQLPSGIGILVQRVVGHQTLLGRSAPKLAPVGRVPLGRFKQGAGHVRWNGRVGGRKLKRGTYQVTVRAVSPKGAILDLGTPHTVRVR